MSLEAHSGVCGEPIDNKRICNGLIENTPEERKQIAKDSSFKKWWAEQFGGKDGLGGQVR